MCAIPRTGWPRRTLCSWRREGWCRAQQGFPVYWQQHSSWIYSPGIGGAAAVTGDRGEKKVDFESWPKGGGAGM